jgi:hypothetical protein
MDFWSVIFSGTTLILAGFNAAIWLVVKFNDMAHIEKNQKEQKDTLLRIENKIDIHGERIAKIEGTCKANHG